MKKFQNEVSHQTSYMILFKSRSVTGERNISIFEQAGAARHFAQGSEVMVTRLVNLQIQKVVSIY